MKNQFILAGSVALVLAVGHAHGQSAQDFDALKKRLQNLEQKTSRLEDENRRLLGRSVAESGSSAGKIKLGGPLTELSLYGDVRLRYQWDNSQPQLTVNPEGDQVTVHGNQRSRWRFRLRLNADFKLGDNWFGGVGLSSNQTPDSGYTTYDGGFRNNDIYISRAFVGWKAADWATIIAGKQENPFYTTELVWDNNINPAGIVEQIKLHQLFGLSGSREEAAGESAGGKRIVTSRTSTVVSPWELTLVAGQLFFDDNNESNDYGDNQTDAYLFEQQLIVSYKFNKDLRATIAPAFLAYTASKAAPNNTAPFSKSNDGLPAWVGETRDLQIIQVPGDVSFKLLGRKTKFVWDIAYNLNGAKRTRDVYGVNGTPVALKNSAGTTVGFVDGADHGSRDDLAFLVGLQVGDNKKKGDWSLFLNYREVGLAAVDPNLNEGTWGSSRTNLRGWKGGVAYNFTDSVVGALTYYQADNIRKNLYGGQATGGAKVADLNSSQIFQVDLNVKF